ncbi:MAG: S6e family ribosomal protein [Candidatus Nanoarchaeia archaeon]|jgi:small subunit ribosomal protein S6e
MEFKLTINDKAKSYKQVVKEPEAAILVGLKIGDKVKGDHLGLIGYELIISGGSDKTGVPMHKGVLGADRAKMIKRLNNGSGVRKTVMGNTISENVVQINLTVAKKGAKELEELFGKKETEIKQE